MISQRGENITRPLTLIIAVETTFAFLTLRTATGLPGGASRFVLRRIHRLTNFFSRSRRLGTPSLRNGEKKGFWPGLCSNERKHPPGKPVALNWGAISARLAMRASS